MIECANCGTVFEPVRTRWLCPGCGWKESCCEGEPQACPGFPVARAGSAPGQATATDAR